MQMAIFLVQKLHFVLTAPCLYLSISLERLRRLIHIAPECTYCDKRVYLLQDVQHTHSLEELELPLVRHDFVLEVFQGFDHELDSIRAIEFVEALVDLRVYEYEDGDDSFGWEHRLQFDEGGVVVETEGLVEEEHFDGFRLGFCI